MTEEEENWARLSFLLIDEGTVWVAQIIQDFLDDKNLELKLFLDNNRKKLEFNCKHDFDSDSAAQSSNAKGKRQKHRKTTVVTRKFNAKPITYEQFKVLFPDGPKQVSLDELDLTLLILVIGILIPLDPPPYFAWYLKKVPDSDLDKASDLLRMRLMRNRLYGHIVECAIPTKEFNVEYENLVKILERLDAPIKELDKIKHRKFTKEERKGYANRITTLFTGDVIDMGEFAKEKMEEIAENHNPKNKKPKKEDEQSRSICHTEVLSASERNDHTEEKREEEKREEEKKGAQRSDVENRNVMFACEECHRYSPEEPKCVDHSQNPQWWRNHCIYCGGEIPT